MRSHVEYVLVGPQCVLGRLKRECALLWQCGSPNAISIFAQRVRVLGQSKEEKQSERMLTEEPLRIHLALEVNAEGSRDRSGGYSGGYSRPPVDVTNRFW